MDKNKITSLRDISKKFDDACRLEESQMDSYKKDGYNWNIAYEKARKQAEKEVFKQKVQANLIVGVVLIVIFVMFFR